MSRAALAKIIKRYREQGVCLALDYDTAPWHVNEDRIAYLVNANTGEGLARVLVEDKLLVCP